MPSADFAMPVKQVLVCQAQVQIGRPYLGIRIETSLNQMANLLSVKIGLVSLFILPACAHHHKIFREQDSTMESGTAETESRAHLADIGSNEVKVGDDVRVVRRVCDRRTGIRSTHRHWSRTCSNVEIGTARVVEVLGPDRSYIIPNDGVTLSSRTKIVCAE